MEIGLFTYSQANLGRPMRCLSLLTAGSLLVIDRMANILEFVMCLKFRCWVYLGSVVAHRIFAFRSELLFFDRWWSVRQIVFAADEDGKKRERREK